MASDENIFGLNWSQLTARVPRTSGGHPRASPAAVAAQLAAEGEARTEEDEARTEEAEARTEEASPMSETLSSSSDSDAGPVPPAEPVKAPPLPAKRAEPAKAAQPAKMAKSVKKEAPQPPAKRAEPELITISSDEEESPQGTPPQQPHGMVLDEPIEEDSERSAGGSQPVPSLSSSPEAEAQPQAAAPAAANRAAPAEVPMQPVAPIQNPFAMPQAFEKVDFGVEFAKKGEAEAAAAAAARAAAAAAAGRAPAPAKVLSPREIRAKVAELLKQTAVQFKSFYELFPKDVADDLASNMLHILNSTANTAAKSAVLQSTGYKSRQKYAMGNVALLALIGQSAQTDDIFFKEIKNFIRNRSDYAPYEDLIIRWMTITVGGDTKLRNRQDLINDVESAQGKHVIRPKGAGDVIETANRAAVRKLEEEIMAARRDLVRPGADKAALEKRIEDLQKDIQRYSERDARVQQSKASMQEQLRNLKGKRSTISAVLRDKLEDSIAKFEADLRKMDAQEQEQAQGVEFHAPRWRAPTATKHNVAELAKLHSTYVEPESARLLRECDKTYRGFDRARRGITVDFHSFVYSNPPYQFRYGQNFYDRLYNGVPEQTLGTVMELIAEMLEFKDLPAPIATYITSIRDIIAPDGRLAVTVIGDAEPQEMVARSQLDFPQPEAAHPKFAPDAEEEMAEEAVEGEAAAKPVIEEDISDVNMDDVEDRIPEELSADSCPAVQLKPHMIRKARDRMRMTTNAAEAMVSAAYWLDYIRTAIGPRRTLSKSQETTIYIDAFAEQVARMIKQYIYYCPMYDTTTPGTFPSGLALHNLVHQAVLTSENQKFPHMINATIGNLSTFDRALSRGGAIYTGAGGYVPGCVVGCAGDSLAGSSGMVYTPRMSTAQERTFPGQSFIKRPEDLQYPLCSWSPVPTLIANRAGIDAPRVHDYILPDVALLVRKKENENSLWRFRSVSGRVFLIPNGAAGDSGCGYRMGRFVCSGLGDEDAYYAWMAEMGKFNGYYFYPLQNVTIYFTNIKGQSEYDQFVKKERMNRHPSLVSVCGYVQVSCCVPKEGNEYESQVWLGAVSSSHIDGSLRTYLDGPDTEVWSDCDAMWVDDEFLGKAHALSYFTVPNHKSDRRFGYGPITLQEMWARTMTAVYAFDWVIKSCGPIKDINSRGCNICPEEFVYSVNGYTASGGPSTMWGREGRTYHKVSLAVINSVRYARRPLTYQYSALGIGGTRVGSAMLEPDRTDYYDRCAGASGDFSNYPYEHTSDPFVPHWALRPEFHAWLEGHPAHHRAAAYREINNQQMLVLLRYIALKMSLGMTYSPGGGTRENVNMAIAEMQFTAYDPAKFGSDARVKQLYEYCQAKADMCLFAAQCVPCLVFEAPIALFREALRFKCGPLDDPLDIFVQLQRWTMYYSFLYDVEKRGPVGDKFWGKLNEKTTENEKGLKKWVESALAFFEDKVAPHSDINLIDRTPLK